MHSWNLFHWQERLGIKRRDQPDVAHIVQPTVIVGDHSAHASQILPPLAAMGGWRSGVALNKSICQLTTRAPGGTYIRQLDIDGSAAGLAFWGLVTTPATPLNALTMNKHDFGDEPTVSTLQVGTLAAAFLTNSNPTIQFSNSVTITFLDLVFVPPGYSFFLETQQDAHGLALTVIFEDVMAPRGAA